MGKETITTAATWFKEQPTAILLPVNITKGVVVCGYSHAHILYAVNALLGTKQYQQGKQTTGFLTSMNRFVDRKEAAIIALNSGQIEKLRYHTNQLFSEDINGI